MKVSEAKEKVCPFMAEMGQDSSGFIVFSKHNKCICGDCMAWEYKVDRVTEKDGIFHSPKESFDVKYNNENRLTYKIVSKDDGHCKRLDND